MSETVAPVRTDGGLHRGAEGDELVGVGDEHRSPGQVGDDLADRPRCGRRRR